MHTPHRPTINIKGGTILVSIQCTLEGQTGLQDVNAGGLLRVIHTATVGRKHRNDFQSHCDIEMEFFPLLNDTTKGGVSPASWTYGDLFDSAT